MSKKALFKILQYVIFLGIGLGIIVYMWYQMDEEEKSKLFEALTTVNYWYLIPIFIGGFLSHYFRALRWKLLLESVEIRPTTANTVFSVLIGYIANLVIPRAGEVAKCTVLAKYEKVPADKMIGTIVAERAFDVLCLILVTATTFMLSADVIGNYVTDKLGEATHSIYKYVIILGGLLLTVLSLYFIFKRRKESKVGKFLVGLADGVKSIFNLRKRGLFLLYTVAIWFMYWLLVQLGFWSMPATAHLGGLTAMVILIFGSLGMIATQGGIGAYHVLVIDILGFYGITKPDAAAFSSISWAAQTGIVLILGAIAIIALPIYNRKQHNAQTAVDTEQDS